MFVSIDDHPELRAPIADVVIADGLMSEELERAIDAVADDGRTNMADVHRLGDIRGRIVDDDRSRPVDRRDAESRVVDRLA